MSLVKICPAPPYHRTTVKHSSQTSTANNYGLNVSNLSTKQWYKYLLERDVTMIFHDDLPPTLKACRTELVSPDTDWLSVWPRVRISCLRSEIMSFIWKLVHGLLPCEGRLGEILPNMSRICRHSCEGDPVADFVNLFFTCKMSGEVGQWLLKCVRQSNPTSTPANILRLDVISGGEALVWVIANTLFSIWNTKVVSYKVSRLFDTRATLAADLEIMKDTRYSNLATAALSIITQ